MTGLRDPGLEHQDGENSEHHIPGVKGYASVHSSLLQSAYARTCAIPRDGSASKAGLGRRGCEGWNATERNQGKSIESRGC